MADARYVFPFGRPVKPARPTADGPRSVFILGAYPSAFHIHWTPPDPKRFRPIQAIAVDNEPWPFWDGQGEKDIFERWKIGLPWRAEYGQARPAGRYNGSSGQKLRDRVLKPLRTDPKDAWITDCLDIYYVSTRLADRIEDTYNKVADESRRSLQRACLPSHPGEDRIVELAGAHLTRISDELKRCSAGLVITLGNAALALFIAMALMTLRLWEIANLALPLARFRCCSLKRVRPSWAGWSQPTA
jgi:hypothetical protein